MSSVSPSCTSPVGKTTFGTKPATSKSASGTRNGSGIRRSTIAGSFASSNITPPWQARGAREEAVAPDDAGRGEVEAAVNEELARLPERYRQAIVLCCLLGKTFHEAGAELGVAPNAVWERVNRGRDM